MCVLYKYKIINNTINIIHGHTLHVIIITRMHCNVRRKIIQ